MKKIISKVHFFSFSFFVATPTYTLSILAFRVNIWQSWFLSLVYIVYTCIQGQHLAKLVLVLGLHCLYLHSGSTFGKVGSYPWSTLPVLAFRVNIWQNWFMSLVYIAYTCIQGQHLAKLVHVLGLHCLFLHSGSIFGKV